MKYCYVCDEEITNKNRSEEHILLNAIGGKLKSNELLCAKCNSKIGDKTDAKLAEELNDFSTFFQVNRDRGENQPIKGGKTHSGEEYNLYKGMTPVPIRINYKEEKTEQGIKFTITARTEKELRKIFNGLKKKKYPGLDVDDVMNKSVWKKEYLSEPLTYTHQVGTDLSLKSVLKTSIDFYVLNRNEKEEIKHLLKYILTDEKFNGIKVFHVDDEFYSIEDDEISHNILLVGDKYNKMLYCYIEFFSTFPFLVSLSMDYHGDNFTSSYSYDVIRKCEMSKTFNLNIDREMVETKKLHPNILEIANRRLKRALRMVEFVQFNSFLRNVIDEERENMFKKYPGIDEFNKEQIEELLSFVNTRISEYLIRRNLTVVRK